MSTDRGALPWTEGRDGLRVLVRVTPRGGRDRVDGLVTLADGRAAVGARVAAPPDDGKANAALLKLLGKAWNVPKSCLRIVSGETARTKSVLVARDDAAARMHDWIKAMTG